MKSIKPKGKFIVIEGGDGAGKGTVIEALRDMYSSDMLVCTREPGGTTYAEAIREVALKHQEAKTATAKTLFGLVWAARHDHMAKLIIPSLISGKHVLCDRFDSSTYAYQVCGQADSELEKLFWTMRELYLGKYVPDLYIFLDVDPEEGVRRMARRVQQADHFDERKTDFHVRVQRGYHDFRKRVPSKVINTNGREKDEVKADVENIVKGILQQEVLHL